MTDKAIIASAPGSLMLFGEHAVLHGHLAMVAAVSQRLRVTLLPRGDSTVQLSSALGEFRTDLRDIGYSDTFRFILSALRAFADDLPSGFDLRVDSEFPPTIGFGSSAAVTAASVAAFLRWSRGAAPADQVFGTARRLVREVQGAGSGADVAASVHGGLVLYRADPLEIEPLAHAHPLTAVYSGSKLATPTVIALVDARRRLFPRIFDQIFETMDQCTMNAADAAAMQDWKTFGQMLNVSQGLMDALGVSSGILSRIVYDLRADPAILGSKISGSGLGDCVIGLGRAGPGFAHATIPVDVSRQGLILEEGDTKSKPET
jgi:mevalonate kinase